MDQSLNIKWVMDQADYNGLAFGRIFSHYHKQFGRIVLKSMDGHFCPWGA